MAKLRPETHQAVRDETTTSAEVILPMIARTHGEPSGILDVGCGPERLWLREAHRIWGTSSMLGLDLDEATDAFPMAFAWDAESGEPLPLRAGPHPTELREDGSPATGQSRWPLVLCLEVAEHLSEEAGDHLVSELCRVAERVVWSAAIPGQGGDGHVNEQPPFYWGARFNAHGFFLTDPWRHALWSHPGVAPWYAQNLMLAQPGVLAANGKVGGPLATTPPPHLVHPAVFRTKVELAAWWRVEWTKTDAERNEAQARYDELAAHLGAPGRP